MSEPVRPDDAALVLIDHQVLSMGLMRTLPLETVIANNIALVRAAQILGIPQVWTSSTEDDNADWWAPELAELDPRAFQNRIKRTGIVDSWNQPEVVEAVKATGRHTLIMAGTSNDGCLQYTALNARRAGYQVTAVIDAGASAFPAAENAALLRMANEGIALTAASTLVGELAVDWSTPTGGELRKVLAENFQSTIGGFSLSK
ncbi:MAG TPA: isochorismatase family protein [Trebonia sp.]